MRAVELFAGAGGLGMGVSKAGFTPVKVVEWDRWCCDTINQNRRSGVKEVAKWPEPHLGDIRPVDFKSLEGRVDIVTGGPPCQPFSLGGKHRGFDDARDMWPEAVRVVRETRPKAFIFENVKGLTRSSFATYFSYIDLQLHHPAVERRPGEDWRDHFARLQQHHTAGGRVEPEYRVVAKVLNAANYGVPQRRERVVFVGFRSNLGIAWSFPEETHSLDALLWDVHRTEQYWNKHRVPMAQRDMDIRLQNKADVLKERPRSKRWQTVRGRLGRNPRPSPHERRP